VNAAGGVGGRPIELLTEDSVNPQVASSKAQRMIERDNVALLCGEISSASALTISQVAARSKKLFMSIGARSDTLRGKDCNRYTFHVDIPVTVMVKAVGQALLRDKLVQGKKIFSLTSDYLFGHDLARVAKAFYAANGASSVGDELVATDLTDFSPFLLKIRQSRPDVVSTNLGGNQVTNFVKQYAEFGLPYPVVGFNLNTADAWAAGEGNLGGIWPTVWHHELKTPGTQAFVAAFQKKYGKLPENHAWIEYVTLRILAQAIAETKGTDTDRLIAYFESEAQFDLLKSRKGWFRSWDHQLMQEAYPFTVKPKGQAKHKQDFLAFGDAVPGPNEPLELLAPVKADNQCRM
jgi:branched-chain amino acid transport system substrate-binding protein